MIPKPVKGKDYYMEEVAVELDAKTGETFDRDAWVKAELVARGLNSKGEPLRPHERERPGDERTLFDFRKAEEVTI